MDCKLLPLSPDVWRAYDEICAARRYRTPPVPPSAIFVAGLLPRGMALLSGAVLLPVDRRFAELGHFVTNPNVPMRARHRAAEITVRAAQTMATILGFTLVAPHCSESLQRFLARRGLRLDPRAMFCPPGLHVPWQLHPRTDSIIVPAPEEPKKPVPIAAARTARRKSKR